MPCMGEQTPLARGPDPDPLPSLQLRNLVTDVSQHKLLVFAGPCVEDTGELMLQTGCFSLQDFIQIFADKEVPASPGAQCLGGGCRRGFAPRDLGSSPGGGGQRFWPGHVPSTAQEEGAAGGERGGAWPWEGEGGSRRLSAHVVLSPRGAVARSCSARRLSAV